LTYAQFSTLRTQSQPKTPAGPTSSPVGTAARRVGDPTAERLSDTGPSNLLDQSPLIASESTHVRALDSVQQCAVLCQAFGLKLRCPRSRYLLVRDDGRIMQLCCNQWGCPVCGPRRRRIVMARASRGGFNCFWTFTFKRDDVRAYEITRDSLKWLRRRVTVFFQWVTRNLGSYTNVMRVLEIGEKGGRLHMHVLFNLSVNRDSQYVNNDKLSRRKRKAGQVWLDYSKMQEHVMGNDDGDGLGAADFEWLETDRAVAYVAPYVTKNCRDLDLPPRTARCVLRGPDVRDRHEPTGHSYKIVATEVLADQLHGLAAGYCCEHGPEWEAVNGPHPESVRWCPCLCHRISSEWVLRAVLAFRAIDLSLMQGCHSEPSEEGNG